MDFSPPEVQCSQTMLQMFEFLKKKKLCDLVVVVEGHEFWLHRCVIAASCPTLHDIIMQEALASPQNTIHLTLQGLKADGFQELIEYLYTGRPYLTSDKKVFPDFKKACLALGILDDSWSTIDRSKTNSDQDDDSDISSSEKEDEIPKANQELVIEVMTSALTNRKSKTLKNKLPAEDNEENEQPRVKVGRLEESDIDQIDDVNDESSEDVERSFHSSKRQVDSSESPQKGTKKKRGRPRLANDHTFPLSPPFICPHTGCAKECETREKLKKHYRIHEVRTHVCSTCGQAFHYNKDLIVHQRIHTGEKPHKCEVCSAAFTQKSTLKNHLESHQAKKTLECKICAKFYSTQRSLNLHKKEKHSEKKNEIHKCEHCGKTYNTRTAYLFHVRANCNSAILLCSQCGKKYKREEPYLEHVRKCTGVVEYKCHKCRRILKSENGLKYHMDSFHDPQTEGSITVVLPKENPDAVSVVGAQEMANDCINEGMLNFTSDLFLGLDNDKVSVSQVQVSVQGTQ